MNIVEAFKKGVNVARAAWKGSTAFITKEDIFAEDWLNVTGAVTPPTPKPPTTSKLFPEKITFEASSDVATNQYRDKAVVLFPATWAGRIASVSLNGEVGFKDTPYAGRPVFRFTKHGDDYDRPLEFVITATDGTVYTASSTAEKEGGDQEPGGMNSETSKTSAWANGNRDHFRLKKPGASYGTKITLKFSNGLTRPIKDGSKREEFSDGVLWKPISDNDGKAVVLGPRNVHISSVTVLY